MLPVPKDFFRPFVPIYALHRADLSHRDSCSLWPKLLKIENFLFMNLEKLGNFKIKRNLSPLPTIMVSTNPKAEQDVDVIDAVITQTDSGH